jgi:hypothetical protein
LLDIVRQIAKRTKNAPEFAARMLEDWSEVEAALLRRGWCEASITSLWIECHLVTGRRIA